MRKKSAFLISLGPPMQQIEAELLLGLLTQTGYEISQEMEGSELLLVNTCAYVEQAASESIDAILELAAYKTACIEKALPVPKLVVTGELVSRHHEALVLELPEVDLFLGLGDLEALPGWLEKGDAPRASFVETPESLYHAKSPRQLFQSPVSAFVKVQQGCLRNCAFCMIPLLHRPYMSRNEDDILQEVKGLLDQGVQEIVLLGQDILRYGSDRRESKGLMGLLEALLELDGLLWLRLHYLHPYQADKALFQLIDQHPKMPSYLDLPFQHISDEMLQVMNRGVSEKEQRALLDYLKSHHPGLTLRTSLMVGHPLETEAHFSALFSWVQEARFHFIDIHLYSDEEGSQSAKLSAKVPHDVARRRFESLSLLQEGISEEIHARYIGQEIPVLVEGREEETGLLWVGRTAFQAPLIDGVVFINEGEVAPGELRRVWIEDAGVRDLVGAALD